MVSENPQISVDDFSVEKVACLDTRAFFLTKCDRTLSTMLEIDFLLKLEESDSRQLIMSNVTFGYMSYTAAASTHMWNQDIPPALLTRLTDTGKIIVLAPGVSTNISALTTEDKILTCTLARSSSPQTALEFQLETKDKNGVQIDETQRIGADSVSFEEFGPEVTEKFLTFQPGEMDKIARRLEADPTLQFELDIYSSDKALDLWYIGFLRNRFGFTTHVTKEFEDFVRTVCPLLQDCVSSQNADGRSRFHYDCCELSTNDDCVPGKEWALEFEVEVLAIGPPGSDSGRQPSSYKICFFHDQM